MINRSKWVVLAVAVATIGGCSSPNADKNDQVVSANRGEATEVESNSAIEPDTLENTSQGVDPDDTDDLYVRPANIPAEMRGLITAEEQENENCRGGSGDELETMKACNRRQVLLKSLEDAGFCWGGASIGADMHWIRCKDDKTYEPGHYDQPYYNEAEMADVSNGT